MGGAVRVGASYAWRTGSVSELPWKIKKQHMEVETKLEKQKVIHNQIIISQVIFLPARCPDKSFIDLNIRLDNFYGFAAKPLETVT